MTILFLDIKGFTSDSQHVHPQAVMLFLNELYAQFDEEAERCGVYKARCELASGCSMLRLAAIIASGLPPRDMRAPPYKTQSSPSLSFSEFSVL